MKTPWQKEWEKHKKAENQYVKRCTERGRLPINKPFEDKVPQKLQDTLTSSFIKAFEVVFHKGTGIIEKTYKRKDLENQYKLNNFAVELDETRKNLRKFSKQSNKSTRKNLFISGVEGIGLGVLGIGIPDIPVFTGVLLKSLYETALNFGYDYKMESERYFILLIIEASLLCGESFKEKDSEINSLINNSFTINYSVDEQIKTTAKALSDELLYMKFLQGIPLVGAIGGAGDALCLQRVQKYAQLKYERRFLQERGRNQIELI